MADEQENLGARLTRSSSEFAGSALTAMSDRKHAVFLLHAATALEHLAKALLATRNPALIAVASKDNFDSLLLLVGETQHAGAQSRIRTIGAREALERASRFAPDCAAMMEDLRFLISVRDGVAHLADASAANVHEILVPYLKASEALREKLGVDRPVYWGPFADLVESALREHVEEAHLRVDAKLAVAKEAFEQRFSEVDHATKRAVLDAIEAGYSPEKYEEQLIECPACGTIALVSGTPQEDYDEDWDHREHILVSVHLLVLFIPTGLLCRACHLELDGRDEMLVAGVGESWYLDDVDESDFAPSSEP